MVYERFRAGEAERRDKPGSAELRVPQRRGPVAATRSAGPTDPAVRVATEQPGSLPSGGHHPAGHVIQGRSILGPAGVLRYPSTSLLRATRLQPLLYSPQPQQICQIGKLPAYGTLPLTWARLLKSAYLHLSHWSRKTRHLPIYGQ